MTDPTENEPQETDADPQSVQPSDDHGAQPTTTRMSETDVSGAVVADDDELPEYIELTPELVEEEAIRGDFMLRWASILLAVLFGFSQISGTRTLVHVRSGDAMRTSGVLPPSEDPFAYSLEGTSSSNVSWLFDHAVSLAYSVGGDIGLSVFKAALAGLIAFLLSRISITGLPTWWNSICGVLAICAVSIDFVPTTDVMTTLGMVILLGMMHRFHEGGLNGGLWKFPLLIAVWANLDDRSYLGVAALLLFTMGLTVRDRLGKNVGSGVGALWRAAGFSVVAMFVNPAPISSGLSALTTYSVRYPTMRAMRPLTDSGAFLQGSSEFYAIWIPEVLQGFEFAYLMGIAIVIVAFVALLISRDREDLPWAFVLLGFAVLGCVTVRELPLAALAAAVAASTAAQRWYARTFRQEYTIETLEVMFSRGGRALTVLAMAILGFCMVADRLPTRSPIGIGFESDLATTMSTLGEQLEELPANVRILPTRPGQGDLLIWHGRKTYVDSRAELFGRYTDEDSVSSTFDLLRKGLVQANRQKAAVAAGNENEESDLSQAFDWRPDFDRLDVAYVMIRLSPPGLPPYDMLGGFLRNPDWLLTSRGPSAAFFAPVSQADLDDEFDIRHVAFTDVAKPPAKREGFGRARDFYQKYLYKTRVTRSSALRDAQHYLTIDSQSPPQFAFQVAEALGRDPRNSELMEVIGRILAGPMMVVKKSNEALVAEPQNASAFSLLGTGYLLLNQAETTLTSAFGQSSVEEIRYQQALIAFRQATVIEPDQSVNWNNLVQLYQARGKTGLALECLEEVLRIEEESLLANPEAEQALRSMYDLRRQWSERDAEVRKKVAEILEQPAPEDAQQAAFQKYQIIRQLNSDGFTRIALEIADENIEELRPLPVAELLRGQMLIESGQLNDGYSVLGKLEAVAGENRDRPEFAALPWQTPVAVSYLATGAYDAAVKVWSAQLAVLTNVENSTPELIYPLSRSLPLVPRIEGKAAAGFGKWPLLHIEASRAPMDAVPRGRALVAMYVALAYLEAGNASEARVILEKLVNESGQHPHRVLAELYLGQLDDNAVDMIASSALDPWEEFEFPEVESGRAVDGSTPDDETNTVPSDPDSQPSGTQSSDDVSDPVNSPEQTTSDGNNES